MPSNVSASSTLLCLSKMSGSSSTSTSTSTSTNSISNSNSNGNGNGNGNGNENGSGNSSGDVSEDCSLFKFYMEKCYVLPLELKNDLIYCQRAMRDFLKVHGVSNKQRATANANAKANLANFDSRSPAPLCPGLMMPPIQPGSSYPMYSRSRPMR